jgi:hypothetical protein
MPVWVLSLLSSVGAVALKMLVQLATESFIKKAVIVCLEKVAALTETEVDNKLLAAAKEAWEHPVEVPKGE